MKPIAAEPLQGRLLFNLFEHRQRVSTCAVLLAMIALATFEFVSVSGHNFQQDLEVSPSQRGTQALEPTPAVEDAASEWNQLKTRTRANFRPGLPDIALPVQMDVYEAQFLANEAPHSIGTYQRDTIGDIDIETSQWQSSAEDGGLTRCITYIHPINVPMAPPRAGATKQQRLTKYGTHGVVLETNTVVNDLPKTDCFVVEDRILLESTDDGGIILSAWFNIRFTKKTVFKSIIEKTTASEFQEWFRKYGEMIKRVVATARMTAGQTSVSSTHDDGQILKSRNSRNTKSHLVFSGGAKADPTTIKQGFPSTSRLPWLSFITGSSY